MSDRPLRRIFAFPFRLPGGIPHGERLVHLVAFLVIIASTLLIFSGIFRGKLINNSFYLFAYEPWAHHIDADPGRYNFILSDDMDAMSISYPTNEHLRRGELPLWNTRWQLGIPEFRIDSGWFYPLRIFWVLFGIPVGMTIEVLLRFALAGIFTYLLLNILGVRPLISLVCALGYVFGSNSIGDYQYGFGPIGLALPVAIYCVERVLRYRRRRDIVYLTLSLILLNTHIMVHVNAMASFWVAAYAGLRLIFERDRGWHIVRLGIAMVFAPLLYAFALLPTLDFYLNYFNSSYREGYSLLQIHPGGLLSLVMGNVLGDPLLQTSRYVYGTFVNSGVFVGFLAGVCGVALAVLRLFGKHDRVVVVLWLVVAFLLLTIYQLPHEHAEMVFAYVPLLKFVKPFYQKLVFQFFVMVLGALGLDYFWGLERRKRIQFSIGLFLVVVATGLTPLWAFDVYFKLGPTEPLGTYLWACAAAHLALVVALVCSRPAFVRVPSRSGLFWVGAFALVGITVLEAKFNTRMWFPYARADHFYPPTQTTDFIEKTISPGGRVISMDRAAVPGLLFGEGIPVAAGRSLPRREYLELLRLAYPDLHRDHPTQSLFALDKTDLLSPVWNLANVNLFVAGKGVDEKAIAQKYGDGIIVHPFVDGTVLERREHSQPYVATYHAVFSPDIETTKELIQKGLDTRDAVVVDSELMPIPDAPCTGEPVKVENFTWGIDSVRARVTTSCPAFFMVSMYWDRGWSAAVDGVEVPIRKAYGFMPVIALPEAGVHEIEFSYLPESIVIGLLVSLGGLIVYILVLRRLKTPSSSPGTQ